MKLISIARYNKCFNKYLDKPLECDEIYQSVGLVKHIEKRHPECIKYLLKISEIIEQPDYIGINPNEIGTSFELVKSYDDIIQLGIKLDELNGYLYVATLYTITPSKLQHNINNGRLNNKQYITIYLHMINISRMQRSERLPTLLFWNLR